MGSFTLLQINNSALSLDYIEKAKLFTPE